MKHGLEAVPLFTFTFFRFLIAAIALAPLIARELPAMRRSPAPAAAAAVVLLGAANVVFFAFGVRHTSAALGQTLYTAAPVLAAALSFAWLGSRFPPRQIIGIAAGLAGALLMTATPLWDRAGAVTLSLKGNLLILGAVIVYALYLVASKKIHDRWPPDRLTALFLIVSTAVSLALVPVDADAGIALKPVKPAHIFSLIYVGVATAVYYRLIQWVILHGSPLIASIPLYLQPAAAFVWSWIIYGEQPTAWMVAGAAFVFAGTALVVSRSAPARRDID